MSEFILKTEKTWRNATEDLPPIGQVVEVLCTMTTKASLLSTDPNMWNQESTELHTEVKLWRETEAGMPIDSPIVPITDEVPVEPA